jgi:hypothetical protein
MITFRSWAALYLKPLVSALPNANVAPRQTIAYHPESNGAVERFHCCHKDALRVHAAAATWADELPFVLLGL